ncbi:hypothetical protein FOE78_02835 [Microlunatus elymi]|uniref:Uncharacterized protein n=1 Tax=Microlunatus elymi TaxID=2596828 RepID=A0A516PVL6_9ACTN|nr:hypothetical protein [Microlunatus elymi]QDP94991.1 hypothetical protein FOE78_02835 [Microlunatus elymi]
MIPGRIDSGRASVMVHLGAPGTVTAREVPGSIPFVSIDIAPEVTLMSRDPDALLLFEREIRRARQLMAALLQSAGDIDVACNVYEAGDDGCGSRSTGADPCADESSGVSGRS